MMDRPSLMQAIEDLVAANARITPAIVSKDLEAIDSAADDLDYFIDRLCKSVGLDKVSLERHV